MIEKGHPGFWLFICLAAVTLIAIASTRSLRNTLGRAPLPGELTVAPEAHGDASDPPLHPALFPVHIHAPSGPPVIDLSSTGDARHGASVSCAVCHSIREPNFKNQTPGDLDEFHQDMPFAHGKLTCFSCHNPNDYNLLRLADQSALPYTDVMVLCSQCHGPQARDYAHGAHGGMNGYWDLTRGPRVRNNCVDCHDPHVPAFPTMFPTFKPRDRFLTPYEADVEKTHD